MPRRMSKRVKGRTQKGNDSHNVVLKGMRGWFHSLITNEYFERLMVTLIVGNAAVIAVQTNQQMIMRGAAPLEPYKVAELVFTTIFIAELLLRIAGSHANAFLSYTHYDFSCNMFDTFLVVASLVDIVVERLDIGTLDVNVLRMLRMVRLVRMLRILRTARFFHELRALVTGIRGSVGQLCWCGALLVAGVFVASTLEMQLLFDARARSDTTWHAFIDEYFGNLPRTMYTLIVVVLGGMDWAEVCDNLFAVSVLSAVLFGTYVGFVQLCLLNIFTGLFVERTCACMQRDKDCMYIEDVCARRALVNGITQVFVDADVLNRGTITYEDFQKHFEDKSVQAYLRTVGIDLDVVELSTLFTFLDHECTGKIGLEDFIDGIAHVNGYARQLDLLRMSKRLKHMEDALW
eukprot:NODE_370_length_1626_cov_793.871419.p1 GENE.NODE_370_length_1626_cov_793.871419~~NODE_370_length_1626_cov_793.871419.p1  ORF type:complete len:404 (+),score=75.41 NODE_370_length_1626_cov_793.871419:223-1434(+)